MKKDCSNIFVFQREYERRRTAEPNECWPRLYSIALVSVSDGDVQTLQKWSDKHPTITRKEKFLQMFPNANPAEFPPCYMDLKRFVDSDNLCIMDHGDCKRCCEDYWNEEVEE